MTKIIKVFCLFFAGVLIMSLYFGCISSQSSSNKEESNSITENNRHNIKLTKYMMVKK